MAHEFVLKVRLAWRAQPAQSLPLQRCRPRDLRLEAEEPYSKCPSQAMEETGSPPCSFALLDPQRGAVEATARGFEPLRAEPNGFLVHHLNHSVTLSMWKGEEVYHKEHKSTIGA